jgi:hypothetical protein
MKLQRITVAIGTAFFVLSCGQFAFAQNSAGFVDLEPGDFGYESVVRLRSKGIVNGVGDGTFRPEKTVTRAEALKMIAMPLIAGKESGIAPVTDFNDVPTDSWFAPYVAWALRKEIISTPKSGSAFSPERGVTRVEFLKMLFLANGVDPNSFGEIKLPLATDVTNTKEWYYPFIRYGLSSSVVMTPKSLQLTPNHQLQRIEIAVLMDRYLQYKEGLRTQQLLDQARVEIETVLDALAKNDLTKAELASARGLLYARGAHASKPDEDTVKVAVKITEAIRALVRAYRAGVDGKIDDVIKLSSDSWFLADQARKISPESETIAVQVQTYAKNFADTARKQKR